jgi:3,4-dihydroxy 2-butanone 4-phosphate synthase/GTP cyclohydrolase II
MTAPTEPAVAAAVQRLHGGGIAVVEDGSGHEPAMLVAAAARTDAATVNFMAREGRGVVSLVVPPADCTRLGLALIDRHGGSGARLAFTQSIEARHGVSTGISAADRARTIAVAADPCSGTADLVRPGHVIPIRADEHGVLGRPGVAEAALDLVGGRHGATVCAILDEDGSVAGPAALRRLCADRDLPLATVEDVCARRAAEERLVTAERRTAAPAMGFPRAFFFRSQHRDGEHLAYVHGAPDPRRRTFVAVIAPSRPNEASGVDLEQFEQRVRLLREARRHRAAVVILLGGDVTPHNAYGAAAAAQIAGVLGAGRALVGGGSAVSAVALRRFGLEAEQLSDAEPELAENLDFSAALA